jgi:hypothetical protein
MEPLEDRRMLSTINWTNRNTFTGTNDNFFDDAFDAYTPGATTARNAAIAVVDAAIQSWERVIQDFNYTNPGTTAFNVSISMNATGLAPMADNNAQLWAITPPGNVVFGTDNKPNTATVTIGWVMKTATYSGSTNVYGGWYIDPKPFDLSDFNGKSTTGNDRTNAFFGLETPGDHDVPTAAGNAGALDLYSTMVHELGHAMGLFNNSFIRAKGKVTSPAMPDSINGSGNYWTIDTATAHTLWTSSDSGGDAGGPVHAADAGPVYTNSAGQTYYGANSLMTSRDRYEGRKLIDDTSALLLKDVFGYSILLPSRIRNFYTTLDADGTLRVDLTSLGDSDDFLKLDVVDGFVRVDVIPGTPVPGSDPVLLTNSFSRNSVNKIVVTMGDGDDFMSFGGGNIGLANIACSILGNEGTDELELDDSSYTGATDWVVDYAAITRGTLGIQQFDFSGLESATIRTGLGGSVGNTIDIVSNLTVNLKIVGGSGIDTLNLKNIKTQYFNGSANVDCDTDFDLGGGLNYLNVDETAGFRTAFWFSPQQLVYTDELFFDTAVVNFSNVSGGVTIYASDNANTLEVFGSPATFPGYQHTIYLNDGPDRVTVYPHVADVGGGVFTTINGNLGISGGDGADTLTVDDAGFAFPLFYTFTNDFGANTTDIFGMGDAPMGVGADFENLDVWAGEGADQFRLWSYLSPTTSLSLHGRGGSDILEVSQLAANLETTISNTVSYTFDGGGDTDALNLHNDSAAGSWSYVRGDGTLQVSQIGSSSTLTLNTLSYENVSVFAGAQSDYVHVNAVASGESFVADAGAGGDIFLVASDAGNAKLIRGQVTLDGGADGASLYVYDTANSTGSIVHIEDGTASTLGSLAGDTLFGAGGSLLYRNLADDVYGNGLFLTLGGGADTIYARPQTSASMWIDAGNPTTGSGDVLNLVLSGVQNPSIHNTGVGAGDVTSDNRKKLAWTGVETLVTNAVVPTGFLVTNTLDSGPGSLRQALLDANAAPNVGGPDVIRFSIPGIGAQTIRPLSILPAITDSVTIDGTSQPGYTGVPVIELDGTQGGSIGLNIASGGNTIRGLAINRFVGGANADIWISGPGGNNVIQGNYLGTNLAGNAVFPFASQAAYGLIIFGSDSNVVGTDGDGVNDAAEGNVIAGNNTAGILIENSATDSSENNVIAGNRIGTSADGNTALGNGRMGVFLIQGTGNRIGTNADGVSDILERNVISGHGESGVYIGDNANVVAGNYIGTNAAGTAALANNYGVAIQDGSNNRIGGTAAGAANLIAFNNFDGVLVERGGTGNAVLGNSIYANGRLGINLNEAGDLPTGVTPNDSGDADTGTNNRQNFPQITTAMSSSTQTVVAGTLKSTPGKTFRIEFFASPTADPSGFGEGQTYLGFISATTDNGGNANFVTTLSTLIAAGQFVSATATDPSNNTSEFSASVPVVPSSSLPNVAVLSTPTTGANFLVTSPAGSSIAASVVATPTTTPPAGIVFPFGLVNFTVSNITPGSSANVTITGLDTSQLADYYKYGRTPANGSLHWYNFLFNRATDSDNAAGTGREFVDGNIVLHLIDGRRGDDDRAANGTIIDIGGPVQNRPPVAGNNTANTYKNLPVVINVLGNDSDIDGTVNPATAAIVGAAGHGTTTINPTTGAITYTPAADYVGPDSFTYKVKDNLGTDSNVATVSITVLATGSIAGTEYLDITGNGLSADDTPLPGVKVYLDTNNNGAWNVGEPVATTIADGSYVIPDLIAGTYKVRQVTPAGYVRTAPATVDHYSVALAVGQTSGANNFSNAALGNPAALTNIVYIINGTTPVSDLRGVTKEGDTVQVSFTVVAGTPPQRFTLVSYTAPGASYDANTAGKQKIFDSDTGVFGPGTYTLAVSNPHSYFQIDFVGGFAIDKLGPAGSNIFYSAQARLFGADNGGTRAVRTSPASLTGTVYRDANNNGLLESGELPLAGVKVTATAGSTTQTVVTDIYGVYSFDNLPAGAYTVTETQPGDYADGKDTLGNKGGTVSNDKFSGINLAAGALGGGYNFGEQRAAGSAFAGNQTQTVAWWNGSNGQALIKALNGGQTAKNLGYWLASNFNNLFGADAGSANNLWGKTNAQVAAYYQSLYSSAARKPETEALALALAVYVTNSSLAGTTGASYGFGVSASGLGAATVSVGANGAAFGINNNAVVTITELLSRTNARGRKGVVWDANGDGKLNAAESVVRNQACSLFDTINNG